MNIFKFKTKKNDSVIKPMGVITTVPRPEQPVNRLSDTELKKLLSKKRVESKNNRTVDPYFLQEISDRLFGPEFEEYIEAIKDLNSRFKPRAGRTGHDIFKVEKQS